MSRSPRRMRPPSISRLRPGADPSHSWRSICSGCATVPAAGRPADGRPRIRPLSSTSRRWPDVCRRRGLASTTASRPVSSNSPRRVGRRAASLGVRVGGPADVHHTTDWISGSAYGPTCRQAVEPTMRLRSSETTAAACPGDRAEDHGLGAWQHADRCRGETAHPAVDRSRPDVRPFISAHGPEYTERHRKVTPFLGRPVRGGGATFGKCDDATLVYGRTIRSPDSEGHPGEPAEMESATCGRW